MKKVKASLVISEPLEKSETLQGVLEESEVLGMKILLFQAEDGKHFLLSPRYIENTINDIWKDGSLIVNIDDTSFDKSPNQINSSFNFSFNSIGRVNIISRT